MTIDLAPRTYGIGGKSLAKQGDEAALMEVPIAPSAWLDAQLQQTADWLAGQQKFLMRFVCA